jgi:hypothetical protein
MPKPASLYDHQVIDGNSNVVPGAQVTFMQGRTKPVIYNDPELKVPARNPYPTKIDGHVTVYLNPGEYEVEIVHPNGRIRAFTHWAVANVNIANVANVAKPEIVERIVEVEGPERIVYRDRVEYVQVKPDLAKLEAAAESLRKAKRDAIQPPQEIADLVRVNETYEQTNTRLLPFYTEAQHMKERAIEDNDKTARIVWELKIRKLDLAMHWMHGRLIETI